MRWLLIWKAADDKNSAVPEPMFARSEGEARLFFKDDYRKVEVLLIQESLNVNIAKASNPFGDALNLSMQERE